MMAMATRKKRANDAGGGKKILFARGKVGSSWEGANAWSGARLSVCT